MTQMTTAVSTRDPRELLQKIAKEMALAALPTSERTCIVTAEDGSKRLAATGISITEYDGTGAGRGAVLYKVSFRFIGNEIDPAYRFHQTEDMAWALVDKKGRQILFGPEQGMLVRERSKGVGSYILSQLIRLLNPVLSSGHFKVLELSLPMDAASVISATEQSINQSRTEAMLRRAGFFVSKSSSGLVMGVNKASDLQSKWDQSKVWFLGPDKLVEQAAAWLKESNSTSQIIQDLRRDLTGSRDQVTNLENGIQSAAQRIGALEQDLEQAREQARRDEEKHQASIENAEELQLKLTQAIEKSQGDQESLLATQIEYQGEIVTLHAQKEKADQELLSLTNQVRVLSAQLDEEKKPRQTIDLQVGDAAPSTPIESSLTRTVRFELGKGVLVLLWAVVLATSAITALKIS